MMLPALLFAGCRRAVEWTHTISVPTDGWDNSSPVIFQLDPQAYLPKNADRFEEMTAHAVGDTLPRLHGLYRAHLSLRYLDDCNASSLRLLAESASLEREVRTDTIIIPLFDADGTPHGSGRFGLNEVSVVLPSPYEVNAGATLTITPADYTTPVSGVQSVTFILENMEKDSTPIFNCKSLF